MRYLKTSLEFPYSVTERQVIKNNLLYDTSKAKFLGRIESGSNYSFKRYELFRTIKGNYFVMLSYWRSAVDGSLDSDRLTAFNNESEFKQWLSRNSVDAYKDLFTLQIEEA